MQGRLQHENISCPLLTSGVSVYKTDTAKTTSVFYGDLARDITAFTKSRKRTGLIIEAPLSCTFDSKGNPCGRSFEKQGAKTRYWYAGLGCTVMSAALFLLHELHQNPAEHEIVLFEGFVSFKGNQTRHEDDARALFQMRNSVLDADRIPTAQARLLVGITSIFGGPTEAPAVIICEC